MENENVLELQELTINSFMGVSKDQGVVISFMERKKNQHITEFVADQGKGKSSRLLGLLYAMGARFKIEKKHLLNLRDGALNEGLKFKWEGINYHVIVTTGRLEVKKLNEGIEKWTSIDEEPMVFLRQVFGPVGLSPFEIRAWKGKKQIEYCAELFSDDSGVGTKMDKLEEEIEKTFNKRTGVNAEVDALSKSLELEPLYNNYEQSMEKFKKPVNAETQKKAFEEAQKKNSEYVTYRDATLPGHQRNLKSKQDEIVELKKKLTAAEKEELLLSETVKKATKWIEDNKNVPKDFEKIQKEWMDLSKTISDAEKWRMILAKEKLLNEKQAEALELTGEIDTKRENLKKLSKKCLPNVEGLEIKVATGIDKTKQEEGLFYQGKPIAMLSESEYVDMWCLIFDAAGMNVIVLENLSSLGSDTVATLNRLAKNGANIFATRVDRKVKDVKVIFSSKIE